MSEINGTNFSVNQINYGNVSKINNTQVDTENSTVNSDSVSATFSDSKAEALGRSMLFKGNDSVNNDLKALLDNPQIAENSDELFEKAYDMAKENGVANPYEFAANIATTPM